MQTMKYYSIYSLLGTALLFNLTTQVGADDANQSSGLSNAAVDQLETVHLSLHPAELPYAVLKYKLLPKGMEQTPGNAAPHYFRAAIVWSNYSPYVSAEVKKLDEWLALPLERLRTNKEAQDFFNGCPTGHWELVYLAARREHCEWDLPIREFNISTLIPELKQLRDLGRLLAFKARIEISRGQFENALETIKTGLAMAQHVAKAPTLVNALVSAKLTQLMLDQIRLLIQQPNCPNLFWALTALPEPMADLSDALAFEGSFVYLFLPELRDVRTAVHTEAEWEKMLLQVSDKLINVLPSVADRKKDLSWYGMGALFAATAYPKAKQQLQEAGYSSSRIKEMSAAQAILTAEVEMFDRINNDTFKWFYVDPEDSLKGLADAKRELDKLGESKQEIIPLAVVLLPSLEKAKAVQVETDRYVAALRIAEAIRLYAARHHDQLPQQLSDIKEVPIPNDPMIGQPFSYQFSDDCAVITSPAPPEESANQGLRWEIRLATGKK